MTRQQKKYVIYTIILLLFCFAVIAVNGVLLAKINQVTRQIQDTRENLAHWQKKEAYSRQLIEEYEKAAPDLVRIHQGFLSPDQIVSFIEKLENLSRDHQIKQKINSAEKKEGVNVLLLSLSLEGDFLNTQRYLCLLENLDNYTKINKLEIDAPAKIVFLDEINSTPSLPLKTDLELIIFLTPPI